MNAPLPEQIAKLPKWAQEHIADLQRRTAEAERTFREYNDSQTPSKFFYDDYVCIGGASPEHSKKYVQTDRMTVIAHGVRLDILVRNEEKGIEIQWDDEKRHCREIAFVPQSFQKAKLVTKENIRA